MKELRETAQLTRDAVLKPLKDEPETKKPETAMPEVAPPPEVDSDNS